MAHSLIITAGIYAAEYVENTIEELETKVLTEVKDLGGATLEEVISLLKRSGVGVFLTSDPVEVPEVESAPVVVDVPVIDAASEPVVETPAPVVDVPADPAIASTAV